jgi:predicted secreted protein
LQQIFYNRLYITDDIQIGDDDTIYLRAERSGTGSGGIYTIIYQAVDDSGNAAVASATIMVPQDQR